jgi:beta-mannosidase
LGISKHLRATPEILKRNHIDLVFEGLDGPAKVYLNEKFVVTANNMFREWRADVKSQLKPGTNHLLVVWQPMNTDGMGDHDLCSAESGAL